MSFSQIYVFGKRFDMIDKFVLKYIEEKIPSAKQNIYSKKVSDIIDVLDRVGRVFADKKSMPYKVAIEDLSKNIKFSLPMIEQTLDLVPQILSKKSLEKRLLLELGYPSSLDGMVERDSYRGMLTAYPKGVVFHVGAGNVFIGILDSLIMGLITKNVNIVKISSKGSNFMNIFCDLLDDIDRKDIISKSFAILKWKGGEKEIEEKIVSLSDLVLVWGGYEVADYYRKTVPFTTDIEIFGPKTSFGIVTMNYISRYGYSHTAKQIVKDCSMWDQAACSNMHDLYIICDEKDREVAVKNLMKEIKKSFIEFEKKLPCGKIDEDEMVEIIKARELARVDKAMGVADVMVGNKFTVIYEKDPSYRLSPLNRTLYIKTVSKIDELKKQLLPYRHYLQSCGLGAEPFEMKEIIKKFHSTGVHRFCELGKMSEGEDGSPHDGRFVLSRLVRWVGFEWSESLEDRIIGLVNFAKTSTDFYSRFYRRIEVKKLSDFKKLPFLTKEHLFENTPPLNLSIFSSKPSNGIYFASGGSTGKPKYVFYDSHEYSEISKMLADAYIKAGIEKGDIVANLFVSGNLWSSFLSVERALSLTDAVSLPIGSSLPLENITEYLKEFSVNALIGLPSFLLKLASYIKEKKLKLRINKIFYGGEYITDEMISYFKDVFGKGCLVRSAGYASADAGVIGYQCSHLEKGFHHLFKEHQYLEIINPDTLKPVKDDEIGEVVITPLFKKRMPLIRYRIGDLARWVNVKCGCASDDPVFEIVGRCDDRIHAGGAHIFVWDIQKAISLVKGLSFNFQIIVDKKGVRDFIEIVVESKDFTNSKALSEKLIEKIMENCQDLAESVKMGWIDVPSVKIVPFDTIERISRTGKIKRVVDRRIKV